MSHPPATGTTASQPTSVRADRGWLFRGGGGVHWLVGGIALLTLWGTIWSKSFPPIPAPFALAVTFPTGIAGRGEPLVTTGGPGDADFLAVRYLDTTTAVLVYDVWGMGGPTSAPFALRPGERRKLEIVMPTLPHVASLRSHEKRPLRVQLDGQALLQADVHFHRRAPEQFFLGTNPLGGTIARELFRGKLQTLDGRILRGGPETLFDWTERADWMLKNRFGQLALAAALGVGVSLAAAGFLAGARLLRRRLWLPLAAPDFPRSTTPPHRAFLIAASACVLVFVAILTGATWRLIYPDTFGRFYDYQAASLLQGRLDVPSEALGGEAFVFEGKTYGYFGPTPALLRLPFVAARIKFGELTRVYLVLYYVATLAAVYALLIHVARLAAGAGSWPKARPVVWSTIITGLGSTFLFLGSRAYVYHEAILCGAACALWAGYFALRYLAAPDRRWWFPALLCGIAAVHARPPVGLFALSMLGCAALAVVARHLRAPQPTGRLRATLKPLGIALLAGLGVLSFNALSYLKFRSLEGAPLRYHVQYDANRLAGIEGRNFHASNFRFNFDGYVWRADFTLRTTFPYFFILGGNAATYLGTRLDLVEPVTAMPYTMPALVLLAVLGALAYGRWPDAREPLAVVLLASLPMSAALFTAVAMSQRYTADFCPPLLLFALFGLTIVDLFKPRWQRVMRIVLPALTLLSVLITLAITLHYEGEAVWGVPEDVRHRYQTFRKTVDGFFGVTAHDP